MPDEWPTRHLGLTAVRVTNTTTIAPFPADIHDTIER
jgi:hypothetical protein